MTHRELTVENLYTRSSVCDLEFDTTAELDGLERPLGQARAQDAIEFGVDIAQRGFNVFALGDQGVGKHYLVKSILEGRAAAGDGHYDWCYVSNFSEPQKPRLLKLEAGKGRLLATDMQQLVEDLMTSLPSSFQNDDYRSRRQEIEDEMSERYEQVFRKLGEQAEERGVALVRTPVGYTLAPKQGNEVITPEAFAKLSQKEQALLQNIIGELQVELQQAVSQLPLMKREASHRLKSLIREVTQLTVEQFIAWLHNKYKDQPQIITYLHEVKEFAIENSEDFLPPDGGDEIEHVKQQALAYSPFHVNVVVDNTDAVGQPVIFEENPTYQNLVGRVEYISQMGTLMTDFTLIRSGALHRANGGYLILEARKLLGNMYAWEGLKRALQAGEIKIRSLQELLSLNSTLSLEPECVPLDVKVILLGEPLLYYLLSRHDPEFSPLFQVAADFSLDAERSADNEMLYARMIATFAQREALQPLDKNAVALIIEQAARLAQDSKKLSLNQDKLIQLMQEADYWARKDKVSHTRQEDVETALAQQRRRRDRLSEQLLDQVLRGVKLIDTQGSKIAQVNGLSVLQLGEHSFGSAARITATARLGPGKVIDIEREANLGGDIHSKAVLILSAYLADNYASEQPLPLSASLVFEQSYGGVDGDSASCAELCVLLSAIGGIPLSQSLAVTGSMNQLGEVQAIGGVNEKIEGFFALCAARGLSGEQGVIIPAANAAHLMLPQEIREAVEAVQFRIYTVDHVEDVMELLSGLSRGEANVDGVYPDGTFKRIVFDRIGHLLEQQQSYASRDHDKNS